MGGTIAQALGGLRGFGPGLGGRQASRIWAWRALGFAVSSLGFMISGLGFVIAGLGFELWGVTGGAALRGERNGGRA